MRRMYGDVDSNEVYREMRSNGVFSEGLSRQTSAPLTSEFSNLVNNLSPFDENSFNGLHYNIRVGSGLAMVHNTKEEVVHENFKETTRTTRAPTLRTRTRTRTRPRTTKKTTPGTTTRTVVTVQTTTSSTTTSRISTVANVATTDVPSTTLPATTLPILTTEQLQTIQPTTAETDTMPTTQQQHFSTSSSIVQESTLPAQFTQEDVLTDKPSTETSTQSGTDFPQEYETLEYVDEAQYMEEEGVQYIDGQGLQYVDEQDVQYVDEYGVQLTEEEIKNMDTQTLEAALPNIEEDTELDEDDEEEIIEEIEEEFVEELEEPQPQQQHHQHQQQPIQYTGESVNACPVYVEVKAPYWANNTRSKTLALLNLYPFEQYIHMEKCKDEGGEMLCRPGCRCEQQYRLHRLLAFDPNNECRGIFSDWFSFPSFCLCKCYNVPEQIIQTMNRLPKKLDLSQPEPKQEPEESEETNKHHAGPGPTHNTDRRLNNHRMPKQDKRFEPLVDIEPEVHLAPEASIPAIFPYEGKAAIMAEMDGWSRAAENKMTDKIHKENKIQQENEVLKTVADNLQELEDIAEEHIDNTVEGDLVHFKKSNKEARAMDDHFFYNNPIVEFKLADGTSGSVVESPRK